MLAHFFRAPGGDRPAAGSGDQVSFPIVGDFGRIKPVAVFVAVGLVADHALGHQPVKGLLDPQIAALFQRPGEKAGIEQMQNRVLDAADVLVHGQPVIHRLAIEGLGIGNGSEAGEIPRRFEEGIEGIRFPAGRLAARRAIHILPGGMVVEWIAGQVQVHVFGQDHRQILFRHRHQPAVLTVNDRNGAAPIPLPGNAPVAQPVVHGFLSRPHFFQPTGDIFLGLGDGHAVEKPGIDHYPIAQIGLFADGEPIGGVHRRHHGDHGQAIFQRKIKIPLVMARASENGPGAVFHEYEIRHIDGQRAIGDERVHGPEARVHALLFRRLDGRLAGSQAVAAGDEFGDFVIVFRHLLGQGMVGGDGAKGGAENGVMAGGVNLQPVIAAFQVEKNLRPG